MGAVQQILLGTGLLTFSALVHVGAIALSILHFSKVAGLFCGWKMAPSAGRDIALIQYFRARISAHLAGLGMVSGLFADHRFT